LATAEIKAVITADDQASGVLANFGKSIAGIGVPLAAVGGAITAFGVMAVNSFNDSQLVGAQLNSVLKSTGGIAGVTADEVNKLSKELQKSTRFSDEQIGSAQNLLLTFTNIGKNIFPTTTRAVLDMATAMGTDLKTTSIQVGKALQDPTRGVTALQKVGVKLTDSQKDLVKSLQDTGDMAGAQAIILKELQTEFGGSSDAAGKTFAGQLDIAGNALDDVLESIGGVIANGLTPFVEKIEPLVVGIQDFIEKNPELVRTIVGVAAAVGVATLALGGLALAIGIVEAIGAPLVLIGLAIIAAITAIAFAANYVAEQMGGWGVVMQSLKTTYDTYLKPTVDEMVRVFRDELVPSLKEFWDQNQNWIIPTLKFIGTVIAGVVIGSILLLVNTIKILMQIITFLADGFTFTKNKIIEAIGFIGEKATYLKNHFSEVVGFIVGFFATLPIKIPFYVAAAIMWVVNFIRSIDWGGIWNTIYSALSNMLSKIPGAFMNMINGIRNLDWGSIGKSIANAIMGFMEGAINGAFSGIPGSPKVRLPRFASGVENFSGGMAIVGERGPELDNLPKGADVIPNNKIGGFGGSGSTTININIGLMTGSAIERREAATRMFEDLKDIAGQRGQTVGQMIGA